MRIFSKLPDWVDMDDPRDVVDGAIKLGLVVRFEYQSKNNHARVFSAWEQRSGRVLGWDHGRDEIREFRFDKMDNLQYDQDAEYVQPTN